MNLHSDISDKTAKLQSRLGLPLWLLTTVTLILVGGWLGWSAYSDYQSMMEREYTLLEVGAHNRSAHIKGLVRSAEIMMLNIESDLLDDPHQTTPALNDMLRLRARQLPETRALALVDRSGVVIGSSLGTAIGFDASKREYFIHQRDNDPGHEGPHPLFITKPFATATGALNVSIVRTRHDAGGKFDGVIIASIDPKKFGELIAAVETAPNEETLVVHEGGDIIYAMPNPERLAGKNLIGGIAFTEHINSGKAETRHRNITENSGRDMVSVFARVPDTPLIVAATRPYANIVAPWRESLIMRVGSFGLIACFLTFMTWLVGRRQLAIEQQEEKFRTVADYTYDWETWIAPDGKWIYCSPSCLRISGREAGAFLNRPQLFVEIVHPEDRPLIAAHMGQIEQTPDRTVQFIFRISRPDGEVIWIEHACQSVFDDHGNYLGRRASNRDITERKQSEDVLKTLATAFTDLSGKAFFDAVSRYLAGVLDVDHVFIGRLADTNDRVRIIGGVARGESMAETTYLLADTPCDNVVGKTFCCYPSGVQVLFPKDDSLVRMGIEGYAGVPLFDKPGKAIGIMVALHSTPLPETCPIEKLFTAFSNRVTAEMQRSEFEEALATAKDAAEAVSRAKSAFLANMSHELRTPMNAIMGMTALALRRATDPKQQDELQKVDVASKHLLALINDILDLSKIEALRLSLECIDFTLGEIASNLANIVGHKAADKGLQFRVEVPHALAVQPLQGDPLRLSQILINLAGNAVKFTGSGHVVVRARAVEERPTEMLLRFEIEDTGIGMSAEEQKRLFRAFEQADSSMTRKYGGTGLGLALSKRLAVLMGGEIGVTSEPGQGSTFWFTARLGKGSTVVAEPTSIAGLPAREQLQARHGNARILIVEDEPVNMMIAEDMLEQAGLRSDRAIDGYEAVVLAQEHHYDLILMDMQMPILNGLDATRSIRADSLNMDTPIVAMTANAFEEDKRICFDAGMDDHVGKPVLPEQLYEAILHWLGERIHTAEHQQQPPGQTNKHTTMNFDDAIAIHIKWKARLSRFVEGSSTETLHSATICRDDRCELGKWIYAEGARYEALPQYRDLVKKHAAFHVLAGEVAKLVESSDRAGAKAMLGGVFMAASMETVKAIMELKKEASKI
jgi:PAS domain S-box-containing protein